jgi:hypothetical protein
VAWLACFGGQRRLVSRFGLELATWFGTGRWARLSAPTPSRLSRSSAIYPHLYWFGFNLRPQTDDSHLPTLLSHRPVRVPPGRVAFQIPKNWAVIGISPSKRQKLSRLIRLALKAAFVGTASNPSSSE